MDLNNSLNINFEKRQPVFSGCLFLCLSFLFLNLLFLSGSSYAYCKKLPIVETVYYQTIYDGDTILLKDGRKIRLIGINTPEIGRKGQPSQAFAQKAKTKLKEILSASHGLNLSYDWVKKDKYKRTLAYIYLPDGTDVQAQMLLSGLAMSIVVLPNEKNLDCYRQLEEKAQKKQQGIWQQKVLKEVEAKSLRSKIKAYRFVRGKVTSVQIKSQMMIVQLDNNLSIRLSAKAFLTYREQNLLGHQIQVRGFVYSYRKKPGMSIYHPANFKI